MYHLGISKELIGHSDSLEAERENNEKNRLRKHAIIFSIIDAEWWLTGEKQACVKTLPIKQVGMETKGKRIII